eukprot:8140779-Lingulodinium_polyedra.AAC.1
MRRPPHHSRGWVSPSLLTLCPPHPPGGGAPLATDALTMFSLPNRMVRRALQSRVLRALWYASYVWVARLRPPKGRSASTHIV